MLTRRDFVKFLGMVGAISLTPLRRIFRFDSHCNCACYDGIHNHMERSSTNSGYTYHRNCYTSLTTSTAIYRWTV